MVSWISYDLKWEFYKKCDKGNSIRAIFPCINYIASGNKARLGTY